MGGRSPSRGVTGVGPLGPKCPVLGHHRLAGSIQGNELQRLNLALTLFPWFVCLLFPLQSEIKFPVLISNKRWEDVSAESDISCWCTSL